MFAYIKQMSLDCSTPTCFLYMTNKCILFKGAHFYIFVHVLYLNIRYIFMEYKKDEHKFIQKKNSIYRHWPDRFHMFLSLVITWGGQLNMVHVLSILWQTLDQIMMFYLMVALTSQSFWVCVLVSEGDCCTVDY